MLKQKLLASIFSLAHRLSFPDNGIVYENEPGEFEDICYRVDTKKGSFLISKYSIEEVWSNARERWETKKTTGYNFTSLHELFDGFDPIDPQTAMNQLKTIKI